MDTPFSKDMPLPPCDAGRGTGTTTASNDYNRLKEDNALESNTTAPASRRAIASSSPSMSRANGAGRDLSKLTVVGKAASRPPPLVCFSPHTAKKKPPAVLIFSSPTSARGVRRSGGGGGDGDGSSDPDHTSDESSSSSAISELESSTTDSDWTRDRSPENSPAERQQRQDNAKAAARFLGVPTKIINRSRNGCNAAHVPPSPAGSTISAATTNLSSPSPARVCRRRDQRQLQKTTPRGRGTVAAASPARSPVSRSIGNGPLSRLTPWMAPAAVPDDSDDGVLAEEEEDEEQHNRKMECEEEQRKRQQADFLLKAGVARLAGQRLAEAAAGIGPFPGATASSTVSPGGVASISAAPAGEASPRRHSASPTPPRPPQYWAPWRSAAACAGVGVNGGGPSSQEKLATVAVRTANADDGAPSAVVIVEDDDDLAAETWDPARAAAAGAAAAAETSPGTTLWNFLVGLGSPDEAVTSPMSSPKPQPKPPGSPQPLVICGDDVGEDELVLSEMEDDLSNAGEVGVSGRGGIREDAMSAIVEGDAEEEEQSQQEQQQGVEGGAATEGEGTPSKQEQSVASDSSSEGVGRRSFGFSGNNSDDDEEVWVWSPDDVEMCSEFSSRESNSSSTSPYGGTRSGSGSRPGSGSTAEGGGRPWGEVGGPWDAAGDDDASGGNSALDMRRGGGSSSRKEYLVRRGKRGLSATSSRRRGSDGSVASENAEADVDRPLRPEVTGRGSGDDAGLPLIALDGHQDGSVLEAFPSAATGRDAADGERGDYEHLAAPAGVVFSDDVTPDEIEERETAVCASDVVDGGEISGIKSRSESSDLDGLVQAEQDREEEQTPRGDGIATAVVPEEGAEKGSSSDDVEADTASDDVVTGISKDIEVANVPGNFIDEQQQEEEDSDHKVADDDVWADFGHYTEGFNDGDGYGYADSDAESEYTPEEALKVLRRAAVRCSTAGYCYQVYCQGETNRNSSSRSNGILEDLNACKSKVSLAETATEVVEARMVVASSFDGDGVDFEAGICRDSAAGVDEVMAPLPALGTSASYVATCARVSSDSSGIDGGSSVVREGGRDCDKKDAALVVAEALLEEREGHMDHTQAAVRMERSFKKACKVLGIDMNQFFDTVMECSLGDDLDEGMALDAAAAVIFASSRTPTPIPTASDLCGEFKISSGAGAEALTTTTSMNAPVETPNGDGFGEGIAEGSGDGIATDGIVADGIVAEETKAERTAASDVNAASDENAASNEIASDIFAAYETPASNGIAFDGIVPSGTAAAPSGTAGCDGGVADSAEASASHDEESPKNCGRCNSGLMRTGSGILRHLVDRMPVCQRRRSAGATDDASAGTVGIDFENEALLEGDVDGTGKVMVVSKGIVMENAMISGDDVLRVEGRLHGTMDVRRLEIEVGATVKGNVTVETACVKGTFDGNMECKDFLVVRRGGMFSGEVSYRHLRVEPGASLEAKMQLMSSSSAMALTATRETAPEASSPAAAEGDVEEEATVSAATGTASSVLPTTMTDTLSKTVESPVTPTAVTATGDAPAAASPAAAGPAASPDVFGTPSRGWTWAGVRAARARARAAAAGVGGGGSAGARAIRAKRATAAAASAAITAASSPKSAPSVAPAPAASVPVFAASDEPLAEDTSDAARVSGSNVASVGEIDASADDAVAAITTASAATSDGAVAVDPSSSSVPPEAAPITAEAPHLPEEEEERENREGDAVTAYAGSNGVRGRRTWAIKDARTMTAGEVSPSVPLDVIIPSSPRPFGLLRKKHAFAADTASKKKSTQKDVDPAAMALQQQLLLPPVPAGLDAAVAAMEEQKRLLLLREKFAGEAPEEGASACDNAASSSTTSPPCSPSRNIKNPVLMTPSRGRWMSASEKAALVEEGKRALLAVRKEKYEREKLISTAASTKRGIEVVSRKREARTQLPSSPMTAVRERSPSSARQCFPSALSSGESPRQSPGAGMEEVAGEGDVPPLTLQQKATAAAIPWGAGVGVVVATQSQKAHKARKTPAVQEQCGAKLSPERVGRCRQQHVSKLGEAKAFLLGLVVSTQPQTSVQPEGSSGVGGVEAGGNSGEGGEPSAPHEGEQGMPSNVNSYPVSSGCYSGRGRRWNREVAPSDEAPHNQECRDVSDASPPHAEGVGGGAFLQHFIRRLPRTGRGRSRRARSLEKTSTREAVAVAVVPEKGVVSDDLTSTTIASAASASASSASSNSLGVPQDESVSHGGSGEGKEDVSAAIGEDSDGDGSDGGDSACVTPSPARAPLVKQARFRRSSSMPVTAGGGLKEGGSDEQSSTDDDVMSPGDGDGGDDTCVRMESDDHGVNGPVNKNGACSTALGGIAAGISAPITVVGEVFASKRRGRTRARGWRRVNTGA